MRKHFPFVVSVIVLIAFLSACQSKTNEDEGTTPTNQNHNNEEEAILSFSPEDEIIGLNKKWTGDLDGIVKRRRIRALVPYSLTSYFIDGAERRGIAYEALTFFEKELNEKLGKTGHVPHVRVIFVPMSRDKILPALIEGYGDLAVANLTITPQRLEEVDFSTPILKNVKEVVVTGPAAKGVRSFNDLAGKAVHVRPSSSYFEHLQGINDSLRQANQPTIQIVEADENFEDEEILEMVNAGLVPMTIVDEHKANFWEKVFDNIEVHRDIAIFSGGDIAWAVRKNNPKLKEAVNDFMRENKKGTLLGNIIYNRYLENTNYVKNTFTSEARQKFHYTRDHFIKYGEQYGIDWLLLAAQGYQESKLNQHLVSSAGAVGIMQIKPSTAKDPNVDIPDIHIMENNIHAGTKYLDFIHRKYFSDSSMDSLNARLFALASYNAGPAKIRKLRRQARRRGLDPNIWFDNVEILAAREIGREPVQYVSNIYKYYASYRSLDRFTQETGKEILEKQ